MQTTIAKAPRAGWLTVLSVLLLLGACASLPDFNEIRRHVERRPALGLTPAHGESSTQAAAVLRRLQLEGPTGLLEQHLAFMEAVSNEGLTTGNDARLLVDGPATYHAMFRAIESARDHINLETYIIRDDALGQRLADALIRKQAEGVQVNMLYDSVGSALTSKAFFERLRQSGVALCEFNPVNPVKAPPWRVNHRDHRKILVVDGLVAFTGGINFDSVYSSGSASARRKRARTDQGWRDTHIEVRGPAVAEFQRLFLATWEKQHGAPPAQRNYFPALHARGDRIIRVIGSSPDDEINTLYLGLLSAIAHSQRTIRVTMAYFVPDEQTLAALKDAAHRGVSVQLILPGFSDFGLVFHAARSHYADLLQAGVRIYERRDALLHAKTAVIDGVWSTVGSANMDFRSYLHNDEVNAIVLGEEFAAQMQRMFEADLREATPIDPDVWARRGLHLRFKEWVGRALQYWL